MEHGRQIANSDIRLHPDRQWRILLLAEEDWAGWSAFTQGGALPSHPEAPVMLQRDGGGSPIGWRPWLIAKLRWVDSDGRSQSSATDPSLVHQEARLQYLPD